MSIPKSIFIYIFYVEMLKPKVGTLIKLTASSYVIPLSNARGNAQNFKIKQTFHLLSLKLLYFPSSKIFTKPFIK